MKKTLIIALLVALVLGIFTACNGDVFEDLVEGQKTITLKINEYDYVYYDWTFDNGTDTLELAIPSGCTTWGDLVGKISITITDGTDTETLPLISKDSDVYFFVVDGGDYYYGWVDSDAKGTTIVQNNTSIALGKTYEMYIEVWK